MINNQSLEKFAINFINAMNNTGRLNSSIDNINKYELETTNHNFSFDLNAYFRLRFIFSWISLVTILIGLIGNLTSFLILINPKMRISTNVFLSNLCVSGFIALFGLLINSVVYELLAYYGLMKALHFFSFFYPYIYPIITTFQMASILLTVCVSVNQFICIYFSKLRNQSKNSRNEECKFALKVVILMYIISIFYCIPYWLKFEFNNERGLELTELGKNEVFNKIVHFYMYLPIAYIIPFSILIFTNVYLIGTIATARKRRLRLGLKKNDNQSFLRNNKISKEAEVEEKFSVDEMKQYAKSNLKIKQHFDTKNDSVMTVILNNPINKNGTKAYKLNFTLNKPQKRTNNSSANAKSQSGMSVTVMLIAVVFLFFICQFPALILHIIQSMVCSSDSSVCDSSVLYKYSLVISKFLLISNLSFNFICYCLFSKRFRLVLRESLPNCFNYTDNLSFKFVTIRNR